MKIAVITPYYAESYEQILRAHRSVLNQTYPVTHILVADGMWQDGFDEENLWHLKSPISSRDCGDTPRWLGVLLALANGFDAVAFLGARDWLQADHIEKCIDACEKSFAKICVSGRSLYRPDGSEMPTMDDGNEQESHCILLYAEAARMLSHLAYKPKIMSEIGDRIMWRVIENIGIHFAFSPDKTYCYQTLWKSHYEKLGEKPPVNAKDNVGDKFLEWKSKTPQWTLDYWSMFLCGQYGLF